MDLLHYYIVGVILIFVVLVIALTVKYGYFDEDWTGSTAVVAVFWPIIFPVLILREVGEKIGSIINNIKHKFSK